MNKINQGKLLQKTITWAMLTIFLIILVLPLLLLILNSNFSNLSPQNVDLLESRERPTYLLNYTSYLPSSSYLI